MINQSLKAIILAAGKSKRILSSHSKILHTICGKPIIDHVYDNLKKVIKKENINFVINSNLSDFQKRYKKSKFSFQQKPLGTAHAVLSAKSFYFSDKKDVLIFYADNPFINNKIVNALFNLKKKKKSSIVILAVKTKKKNEYGRLILNKNNEITEIVEYKDANSEQKKIQLCNSGIMLVDNHVLRKLLPKIKANNKKKEYYLTDIVGLAKKNNYKIDYVESDFFTTFGINTGEELSIAENYFQNLLRKKFISSGVRLLDPKSVFFSYDTKINKDVVIEPNVFFGSKVIVKENVIIKSFSHLEGVRIMKNTVVGPFARLRPGTIVGSNSQIGNFVELKNTSIKNNSKVNHLTYLGDAEVGTNVNIGAGTITCNYDGFKKHKTHIENNVFVGSNTSLVAPVKLKNNSIIGAGSVITKTVNANALALERSQQKIILNYRKNRKK